MTRSILKSILSYCLKHSAEFTVYLDKYFDQEIDSLAPLLVRSVLYVFKDNSIILSLEIDRQLFSFLSCYYCLTFTEFFAELNYLRCDSFLVSPKFQL